MTELERPAFSALLAAAGSAFGRELDGTAYAGYWMALSDLGAEEFHEALAAAMRQSGRRYMPTAGEIRDLARPEPEPPYFRRYQHPAVEGQAEPSPEGDAMRAALGGKG